MNSSKVQQQSPGGGDKTGPSDRNSGAQHGNSTSGLVGKQIVSNHQQQSAAQGSGGQGSGSGNDLRQNSVNAPGQSPGQGAGSGQNAASGGQEGGGNLQLNAGLVAGSYIHGGKSKGAALNMSTQNPQGSMNSMRLRNLKGGPGQSHNQILGPVAGHGGMNPGHHRKSNSNSVNSHAAVMSGKQQMGSGNGGGFGNMKFVKPSELSLDLISPSGIRSMGIKGAHGGLHNQTALSGGPSTGTNNNQNMQNILQNFRTPQNMGNVGQQLSMYGSAAAASGGPGGGKSPKELPGIHGASAQHGAATGAGSSSTNASTQLNDLQTLQSSYQYKKRNVSGNHRNIISLHNQNVAAQYIHGPRSAGDQSQNLGHGTGHSNSLTPSKVGGRKAHILSPHGAMGGFHHGINSLGLAGGPSAAGHGSNNSKTPKEAYKRIQGIVGNHGHHSYTDSRTDPHSGDRLNLGADIVGRHGSHGGHGGAHGSGSMDRHGGDRHDRHDRHGHDRHRHEGHSQQPGGAGSSSQHQMAVNQMGNSQNARGSQKKHHVRDYSLRMSRITDDKILNNSVHEFANKKQPGASGADLSLHDLSLNHGQGGAGSAAHHSHSKSLMKSPVSAALEDLSLNLPDKKKEILDKKRYEQMQKNYNQQASGKGSVQGMPSVAGAGGGSGQMQDSDQGQAGDFADTGAKLDSGVQLNLENLTKIDEKFQQLIDQLKVQKVNNISQLCSDWWELTDEDDYSIAKFEKAIKDDKVRRELRNQMTLEILSIAVVNYYTSAPDVLKPTHLQIQQVKSLLNYIQQNFLGAVEVILARLPNDLLHNNFANQLQNILKQKRNRKSKSSKEHPQQGQLSVRQMNDQIINILKGIIRQGQQAGANANMSAKRLFQMRSQGLLKSSYVTGAALRPLYVVISKTLKNLENSTLSQVRNNIIKASEEIERFKQYANLPPLYGVGGTAIGGYEPLPTPDPPYLPEQEGGSGYCLVLDLDETLVHYFEVGSEGTFLVRPGCDQFLTEMAEIYEVVIFTAAMQDYADWVLDQIDKAKRIKYRLYRQHALPHGPVFVKDLSRIGRDLSKTIIVDNVAENFQLQPDNGIFIKSWFDDMNDTALSELAPLLKQIVKKQVPDVRDALRKFRDQMLEQIAKGVTNPQLSLD